MPDDPLLKVLRDKALQYCSRKECSSYGVTKKLISWGCPSDKAPTIIAELQEQRFIDDKRYALAYISDKARFSKWGRIKIRYMLRGEGFPSPLIDEAMDEAIDEEDYLKSLQSELKKKRKSLHSANDAEMQAKLFRFAAGRGFEPDVIYKALRT